MSGHSKWANIKHKKAKGDAAKAKIFTKIGREIAVAVRNGGADPDINTKLKDIIAKARTNNMPNDRIYGGIKKASGDIGGANYEEMIYEGYGVAGTAVIVETLSDNKNRTAGEVRCAFDKYNGSMGSNGCVAYMFNRKGVLLIEKTKAFDFDAIMDFAIEAGADDVVEDDDVFEVIVDVANFSNAREFFEKKNIAMLSAEIDWLPQNTVTLNAEQLDSFKKMIDKLEESDDVQNVFHNCENFNDGEDNE